MPPRRAFKQPEEDFEKITHDLKVVPSGSKARRAPKSSPQRVASFVQPMEYLPIAKLPEGGLWIYEVKLDGYRAIGINAHAKVTLLSRRGKSLNRKFPDIAEALNKLPAGTCVDGEVVALDKAGRPDFNLLTHSRGSASTVFYVFDLLSFTNRCTTGLPLVERRNLLKSIPMNPPLRLLDYFETSAAEILDVFRQHHHEGVAAKRLDSPYEPGRRSGAWVKHRINRG